MKEKHKFPVSNLDAFIYLKYIIRGDIKMKELEIAQFIEDVSKDLKQRKTIVLATCDNCRVTARAVYYFSDGLKLYFLTSKAYTKYKQILKNPNVGLCVDNIQIEGVAHIKGHPKDEENKAILELCASNEYSEFTEAVKYKNTVLIEVEIKFVEIWKNHGRECLDLVKNEAYRIG